MSADQFNHQLMDFLSRSTTPFHATEQLTRQLQGAGFQLLEPGAHWQFEAGGRYYSTRNGSSIVAFVVGNKSPAEQGWRMIGAHTDSPCLKLKPQPEVCRKGYFQLGVEIYGGVLLNPWFDRDLSLAGRVTVEDTQGQLRNLLIDFKAPLAVIPSLAIHLDSDANKNRSINPQTDVTPILSVAADEEGLDFRDLLHQHIKREYADMNVSKVLDFELSFYDSQPPALIGLNGDFLASARLDNLLSCFCGLQALKASDGEVSALLVCNDHEEVGSQSTAGAQGPMLQSLLRRVVQGETDYAHSIERSMMISADNAHGVHPNYADKHDDNHGPQLNAGPVIKVNASQRYASNSETAALFRQLAASVEVPVQSFVTRADMACGSTIGPIAAGELGVRTVDVGVPQFAMHSIRELAGSMDAYNLTQILSRYVNYQGPLGAS